MGPLGPMASNCQPDLAGYVSRGPFVAADTPDGQSCAVILQPHVSLMDLGLAENCC